MKRCKHCKSEIDAQAKICPNCRKKQGMSIWLKLLIAIFVIAVLGRLLGDQNSSSSKKDNEKTGTTKKEEAVVFEDGHSGSLDDSGIFYYVNGYVKNNSDKEYSYVHIEFTTYDAEGNTLGSCSDTQNSLEANGRWKVHAICTGGESKDIASYKLKEISKW